MRNSKNKKVVVAMSGGLDSSVTAALLKKGRFYPELGRRVDVIGVFMKFWSEPFQGSLIDTDEKTDLHRYENRCCSLEAENRARKVAKILKIPFYVFNFEKEFKKRIVDYFLAEYKAGKTPNPCVVCNKEIKFGLLLDKALALDADFVATGHYALKREIKSRSLAKPNKARDEGGALSEHQKSKIKNYRLLRAKDKTKDQSYFLWQLNQKQLKHILLPVGNYTKDKVRSLAKKFELPVFDIPESMEICFVQTTIHPVKSRRVGISSKTKLFNGVNDFLARYLKQKPGQIIYSTPEVGYRVIGRHQGIAFYTIGQRKGIGLPGGPYYVLNKDLKKNLLIVTKNEKDLYKKELITQNVNWVSGKMPKLPLKVQVKIRYRHKPATATIAKILNSKFYILKFDKSQRAITPGQSAVFYKDQDLLGGGVII